MRDNILQSKHLSAWDLELQTPQEAQGSNRAASYRTAANEIVALVDKTADERITKQGGS